MKEKELSKRSKKSSESGKWLFLLIILLAFIVGIFFLFVYFSRPDRENFEITKKSENEIGIYGINENEVNKID